MYHWHQWLRIPFLLLLLIGSRLEAHGQKEHVAVSAPTETIQLGDSQKVSFARISAESQGTVVHHSSGRGGVLELLADNHAVLTHFPIAWVLLLVLLDTWTLGRRHELLPIGHILAILAALSFLPAAATGLLHASMMVAPPALLHTIETHRLLALITGLLVVIAAGLRWYATVIQSAGLRAAYLGLVLLALALVLTTGHLGGIVVRS